MSSVSIASIVFACVFGSALLGMFVRTKLPVHHLNQDSKDVVKLAMGLIATMAALVLGLLTASAKAEFDTQTSELQQAAAKVIQLDRVLAHYGPETNALRDGLRQMITNRIQMTWPEESETPKKVDASVMTPVAEGFIHKIRALVPQGDDQHDLQAQAVQLGGDMLAMRWLMFTQESSPLPFPFLVVLVLWLSVLFGSFGLFAPRNATVVATLLLCAVAVSSSIFLILEMNKPMEGLIKISSAPLHFALSQLGK